MKILAVGVMLCACQLKGNSSPSPYNFPFFLLLLFHLLLLALLLLFLRLLTLHLLLFLLTSLLPAPVSSKFLLVETEDKNNGEDNREDFAQRVLNDPKADAEFAAKFEPNPLTHDGDPRMNEPCDQRPDWGCGAAGTCELQLHPNNLKSPDDKEKYCV